MTSLILMQYALMRLRRQSSSALCYLRADEVERGYADSTTLLTSSTVYDVNVTFCPETAVGCSYNSVY